MTIAEWVTAACLGGWFALNVAVQFSDWRVTRFLRRYDWLGVLSNWALFGPRPQMNDVNLLWRPLDAAGEAAAQWKELRFSERDWRLGGLWHPHRRERAAVMDGVRFFHLEMRDTPDRPIESTVSYNLLLHYVTDRVPAAIDRLQFLVLRIDCRTPARTGRVLLLSKAHDVRELRAGHRPALGR
jgi:hypothetical protein